MGNVWQVALTTEIAQGGMSVLIADANRSFARIHKQATTQETLTPMWTQQLDLEVFLPAKVMYKYK